MSRLLRLAILIAALGAAANAAGRGPAMPNGAFLVAKPGLLDPNFSHSVVLVTRTPGGGTLGVIVNHPTGLKLAELLPKGLPAAGYHDKVFFGGPVMLRAIVATVGSRSPPGASALRVLDNVYLTMSAADIRTLLRGHGRRYRLYVGFSSWAPGQLAEEVSRGSWYIVPADQATVFRRDTHGLWRELVDRARAQQVRFLGHAPPPSARRTSKKESPAGAGL